MNNQDASSSPGMGLSENVQNETLASISRLSSGIEGPSPPRVQEAFSALSTLETEIVGKTQTRRSEQSSLQRHRSLVISTGVSSNAARQETRLPSSHSSSPYLEEPIPSSPGQRMEDWLAVHEEIATDAETEATRSSRAEKHQSIFCHLWWCFPVTLVVVGALVLLVVLLTKDGSGGGAKESTNNQQPFRFEAIRDCFEAPSSGSSTFSHRYYAFQSVVVYSSVGDVGSISEQNTPQRKALCWLSDFDALSPQLQDVDDEMTVLQRYAMAVFYFALVDESLADGLGKSNWLGANSECTWQGVSCTVEMGSAEDTNSVTRIALPNASLRGHVPPEIGDIRRLEFLFLGKNEIVSLPSALFSLSLRMLSVEKNLLSSTIPTEVGKLSQLRLLSFADNQISGTIATELGQLTNLLELFLRGNFIAGSLPSELGLLKNLGQLVLSPNRITGSIPSEIGNLNNLEHLDISHNSLFGYIPTEIGYLSRLSFFDCSGNGISGIIPTEIGLMESLSTLFLLGNFLTSTIPGSLSKLTNLESLGLGHNKLSGDIPSEIGRLSFLEELIMLGCDLSGQIPTELGQLKSVEIIFLKDNNLVGSMPQEVCNLRTKGNLRALEADCFGGNNSTEVACPASCCTRCS